MKFHDFNAFFNCWTIPNPKWQIFNWKKKQSLVDVQLWQMSNDRVSLSLPRNGLFQHKRQLRRLWMSFFRKSPFCDPFFHVISSFSSTYGRIIPIIIYDSISAVQNTINSCISPRCTALTNVLFTYTVHSSHSRKRRRARWPTWPFSKWGSTQRLIPSANLKG